MNRAERRKAGISQPKPKMKHLPDSVYHDHLNQAYRQGWDNAFEKASNIAVAYMLGVPLLVLNEKFGEVRLKEFEGKSRVEHFFDLCTEMFDNYNSGDDTLERLLRDVKEKTGFDIEERVTEK